MSGQPDGLQLGSSQGADDDDVDHDEIHSIDSVVCLVRNVKSGCDNDDDDNNQNHSAGSSSSSISSATGNDAAAIFGVTDEGHNNNNSSTVQVVVPRRTANDNEMWGNCDTPLYKSMIQLTVTTGKEYMEEDDDDETGQQKQQHQQKHVVRLGTPSAARAEDLAKKLYDQVNTLIESKGNSAQQKQWENATIDQQSEWIASFFLRSSMGLGQSAAAPSSDPDQESLNGSHLDDDGSSDSDDWGKEELVFPPSSTAADDDADADADISHALFHKSSLDRDQIDYGYGDEYWATSFHIDNDPKCMNNNDGSNIDSSKENNAAGPEAKSNDQQLVFLVDMTRLDPSIHCKFDKNGVNDIDASRRLRKKLEENFDTYKRNTSLLADGTVIPCSIGVWKPALQRIRDERSGHYVCPIFRPLSSPKS